MISREATMVMLGLALALASCASAPPQPAPSAAPPIDAGEDDESDAGSPEQEPAPASSLGIDAPERTRPPSTATYDQAMSTPENLDVGDERPHLTDAQLRGPMRAAPFGCRVPGNAKITIKTAVQNGRAIGVTVEVRFEHPPPKKPPKKPTRPTAAQQAAAAAAAKREAKAAKEIGKCVDKAVRLIVWPPNVRRDSFTTDF